MNCSWPLQPDLGSLSPQHVWQQQTPFAFPTVDATVSALPHVHIEKGEMGFGNGQHSFPTWTDHLPVPMKPDYTPMIMPGQTYFEETMEASQLPRYDKTKAKLSDLRPLQPLPINTFEAATPPANQPLAAPGPGIQLQQAHESYMPIDMPGSVRPYFSEEYLSSPEQTQGEHSRAGFQEMAWMASGGHSMGGYEPAVGVNGEKMGAGEESMRVPSRRNIFRRRFPLLTSMLLGPEEASCESETDYSLPTSLPESIGRRMRAKVRPGESNMTAHVSGGDFGGRFNRAFSTSNLLLQPKSSFKNDDSHLERDRQRRNREKGIFVVNDDYTQDPVKRVGRALRFACVLEEENCLIWFFQLAKHLSDRHSRSSRLVTFEFMCRSAEIDQAFLILLPFVFFVYLFIEFVFLAAKDSSIWRRMVTLNVASVNDDFVQTVVSFENSRDPERTCFQKQVIYDPLLAQSCEGFN